MSLLGRREARQHRRINLQVIRDQRNDFQSVSYQAPEIIDTAMIYIPGIKLTISSQIIHPPTQSKTHI
jgi:hypothetical protein